MNKGVAHSHQLFHYARNVTRRLVKKNTI